MGLAKSRAMIVLYWGLHNPVVIRMRSEYTEDN